MAVLVVAGGWVYFMRKRVSLSLALAGGIALGFLMLFLVANRGEIHLGSELEGVRNPVEFLERWESNEYLIGSAAVRLAQDQGGFYGTRQLTHLLGRFIPAFMWPGVYEDLSQMLGLTVNIKLNAGVDPVAIGSLVGWQPSVGSATGFVGASWLEFQYAAPLFAIAVGYFYGRVWKLSRSSVSARVFYLLILALSVYLVMQDTDAWLYRVLLLGIPLWVAAGIAHVRQLRRSGDESASTVTDGASKSTLSHANRPLFENAQIEVRPARRGRSPLYGPSKEL